MKTMLRSLFVVLLVWLGTGLQTAAADGLTAPQRVIQETSARLYEVLHRERERLLHDPAYVYQLADELFLPHVDMEGISRLVLGRHWRNASATQKRDFMREFQRLLVRTYASALRELKEWDMRFMPLKRELGSGRTLVKTQVLRSGAPPLAIDYSMVRKQGLWLAYDVKIEGISLVTNYRSSFASLIRSKGIGGLIHELATRNDVNSLPSGRQAAVGKIAS